MRFFKHYRPLPWFANQSANVGKPCLLARFFLWNFPEFKCSALCVFVLVHTWICRPGRQTGQQRSAKVGKYQLRWAFMRTSSNANLSGAHAPVLGDAWTSLRSWYQVWTVQQMTVKVYFQKILTPTHVWHGGGGGACQQHFAPLFNCFVVLLCLFFWQMFWMKNISSLRTLQVYPVRQS